MLENIHFENGDVNATIDERSRMLASILAWKLTPVELQSR